jgi:hypothetical protein
LLIRDSSSGNWGGIMRVVIEGYLENSQTGNCKLGILDDAGNVLHTVSQQFKNRYFVLAVQAQSNYRTYNLCLYNDSVNVLKIEYLNIYFSEV